MIREALCVKCRDDYAEIDEQGHCKRCGSKVLEPLKKPKKKKK